MTTRKATDHGHDRKDPPSIILCAGRQQLSGVAQTPSNSRNNRWRGFHFPSLPADGLIFCVRLSNLISCPAVRRTRLSTFRALRDAGVMMTPPTCTPKEGPRGIRADRLLLPVPLSQNSHTPHSRNAHRRGRTRSGPDSPNKINVR